MALDSTAIRHRFLSYFRQRHHKQVLSSPVLAAGDPTLLFTNAGMNQFKDHFLGLSQPPAKSITTCQACIRAGGKHNDLENVGHTKRHLTLFEMVGNFSFGDYFKRQAIDFAWEVATEVFALEPKRIYPTVFEEDDEAFELWLSHVPKERITRLGKRENFWTMGATGPCGPCSELLYDRGPEFGSASHPKDDSTGERFLEFWNLVFMQSDLSADGSLRALSKPMIDTGAGLERIAMLKMGVDSVFETDVLRALISCVEGLCQKRYGRDESDDSAMRVIADHCRSIAFCIADGALPSNVEQGYVVRKLIRRAMRYGKSLDLRGSFLPKILPVVGELMGADYPRLLSAGDDIARIVSSEELSFLRTLDRGGRHFNDMCALAQSQKRAMSGREVFTLKDTYGLPFEEIAYLAEDAGVALDERAFRELDAAAKHLAKQSAKKAVSPADEKSPVLWNEICGSRGPTPFCGYEELQLKTRVLAILSNGVPKGDLLPGDEAEIALEKSPFYSESGGQVGDRGSLIADTAHFAVRDCQLIGQLIIHKGVLKTGQLAVGMFIHAEVDQEFRHRASCNHTATHLLDWALGKALGCRIEQAGSLVQAQRLRYDIRWPLAIGHDLIDQIEELVNGAISADSEVSIEQISLDRARQDPNIQQQFGDKYGSVVRLVTAGGSKSLCCGTHAKRSGQIGYFRIVKESSVGAGLRRIEAVTGPPAHLLVRQREQQLSKIAKSLQTSPEKACERLEWVLIERAELQQQISEYKNLELSALARTFCARAPQLFHAEKKLHFRLVIERVEQGDLRALAGYIASDATLAVLIGQHAGNARILLRLSTDLTKLGLRASDLWAAFQKAGFRGKGGLDMAQGAGPAEALEGALSSLKIALTS